VIDLHAHVLPAIDDGPASMAESLALVAAAADDGVSILAATPHVRAGPPSAAPGQIASATTEMEEELRRAGLRVLLVSGAEVDLAWAATASDEDLRACTYGAQGLDLLVETPYGRLPDDFEDMLFGINVRGFRPLLAHPERSPAFQREPRRLARIVELGTLVQVTSLALTNPSNRSRSRRLAERMISEGIAHVISSDAHSATGPRPAGLTAGVEAAAALTSAARAEWMVRGAPAAILAGEPLPPAPPLSRRRFRLSRPW
jgi:protein-tyrosine phosphatase